MENRAENPTKLLLHACCGPCSMEPVRLLRERGIEPHIYYANPNIHPREEYDLRLSTIRSWAARSGLTLTEGAYDAQEWEKTAGRVGDVAYARFGVIAQGTPTSQLPEAQRAREARCRACYRLRFEQAARFACENGFDALGTTLSVSPYQYTDVIREELERAAQGVGIRAQFEDYRPYYDNATRRSREEGLYRQNFCGCRFSQEEARIEREARRLARAEKRAQKAAEHAKQRAAEAAHLAEKRASKQAYAAKQARKHAILKALRENA